LRIEMQAAVASFDPADWPAGAAQAAAKEKLVSLVFERLVQLDQNGQLRPQLALSWQHDGEHRRWQFRLRAGVTFSDGTPLTPDLVVTALEAAAWGAAAGCHASGVGGAVEVACDSPQPGLLFELARPQHAIFLRPVGGPTLGTGPFRSVGFEPSRRASFVANEGYWGGRPYLDAVEVKMSSPLREQMIALEIGQADVVELAADQARKAALGGKRVWSSAPLELLALVFSRDAPATRDARLREALALSLDRSAMYNVLVQKQGEPAGGLLPQWLSGYAFLFATARDLDRARKLVSELSPAPAALLLACDSADPLARAVADRIAVNAREAGLSVKVTGTDSPAAEAGSADVRLVRTRVPGVEPPASLRQLAQALGVSGNFALSSSATLEETYAAERTLVESHVVIPLLHLPAAYALGSRTKNWLATRWDDWRLAEAWVEAEASEEKR